MKKLIIVIMFLVPLSLCAQTGRVNLTGALHPLNWAFPIMLDLRHVGLVATAASIDADSNGLIDKAWLDWPDMILGDFQYQTNWRLFYSDGSGDVTELAFGTSGQYLKSTGTTSAPEWDTPSGGSGMPAADFNDSLESQVHFSPKLYEKIDSTSAKIPTAELADSTVAVPDSIDCNAITVNRRVKAQAIDVDTVDVGGDEIIDFTWTGLYVTNHKLAVQLGTSIVSGEIVNQTIVRDDIDSSAGLTLLHLHKYNSNDDDSSYLTKGYIDGQFFTEAQVQAEIGDSNAEYLTRVQFKDSLDAAAYLDSSNLANQGITPDDIDTTDNKFVFSDVYRGTSAQAESVFVTIETIEDTATLCGRHAGQVWTGVHDYGGATSLEIPNAANPTVDAVGEIGQHTGVDGIEIFDGDSSIVIGACTPICKTIIKPDSVQVVSDAVPIWNVNSHWAPNGITIKVVGIIWNTDISAIVNFEAWDDPQDASPDNIDGVETTNADEGEDSDIFAPDVAAGKIIYVDLPGGTGATYLEVWFVYTIKDD